MDLAIITGTHLFNQFYTLIEICGLTRKIMKLIAQTVVSLKQNTDVGFY